MNITVTKVLRELKNKHGWENMNIDGDNKWFIEHLIKDTIDVINDELIKNKTMSPIHFYAQEKEKGNTDNITSNPA